MSADIYTEGFNDNGLFNRLLLLTNLYSPDQLSRNVLRPVPTLGDNTLADGSENFDVALLNPQVPILTEAGSSRQEDNRKPIKKKAKPKKMAGVLYPQIGNSLNAYRIDYGVFCYQLPSDSPNGASRLDAMRFRRTWCLNQMVITTPRGEIRRAHGGTAGSHWVSFSGTYNSEDRR